MPSLQRIFIDNIKIYNLTKTLLELLQLIEVYKYEKLNFLFYDVDIWQVKVVEHTGDAIINIFDDDVKKKMFSCTTCDFEDMIKKQNFNIFN